MDTTSKGNHFETQVYDALKKELANERLCVSPRASRIIAKPKYYSRDREKDITFDISIEIRSPSKMRPSLIWIFECKDESRPVSVDEVEEFHSKLEQISQDKRAR